MKKITNILSCSLIGLLFTTIPCRSNAIEINKVALVGGIGGMTASAAALYLCYKKSKALKAKLYGDHRSVALVLDQEERKNITKKLSWCKYGMIASSVAALASVSAAGFALHNLLKTNDNGGGDQIPTAPNIEDLNKDLKKLNLQEEQTKTLLMKKNGFLYVNGTLETTIQNDSTTLRLTKEDIDKELGCLNQVKSDKKIDYFKKEVVKMIKNTKTDNEEQKFILKIIKSNTDIIYNSINKLKKNSMDTLTNHEQRLLALTYKEARLNEKIGFLKTFTIKYSLPEPEEEKKE